VSTTARDSDPLLRAVAAGDEHCPDGVALARLGRILRAQGPVPADLRGRVIDHLVPAEADTVAGDPADAVRIDRHFANGEEDAELAGLGELVTSVRPAPTDLRERVRRQLAASVRLAPVSPNAPVSTRAQAEMGQARQRRVRVITWVVGFHVAALLAFALFQVGIHTPAAPVEDTVAWISAKPVSPLPAQLPKDWTGLAAGNFDLLALRRTPELRAAARRRFNCEPSAGAVACGLRWLISQQQADGSFGSAPLSAPLSDAQIASQALVTLALLGEGSGGSPSDKLRLAATTRAVARLAVAANTGAVPRSLVTLAKVEAALLALAPVPDAEAALADLAGRLPADPGAAGLGGFALLAVETAVQAGYTVPPRLALAVRSSLGRQLPPLTGPEHDLGRIGLAAFARLVLGYRENPSTTALLGTLGSQLPTPAAGDGLGWFFAGLALREAGGPAWDAWIAALQASLGRSFVDAGPGLAMVPAEAVRHAPDALFATAIAVLDLQVAYRYLPTAP
jgi:hypothetical protein